MKTRIMVVLEPTLAEAFHIEGVLREQGALSESLEAIHRTMAKGIGALRDSLSEGESIDDLAPDAVDIELGVDADTLGELAYFFATRSRSIDTLEGFNPNVGFAIAEALIDIFVQSARVDDAPTQDEVRLLGEVFDFVTESKNALHR